MMVAIATLGDQNRRNNTVNDLVGVAPILHGTTEDVATSKMWGRMRVCEKVSEFLLNKYQNQ